MADFLGTMTAYLPVDGWQRLLLDALWQSTLIGITGLITAGWWRHHAAGRAWVLLLAVTACAVVPLSSQAARSAGWTVLRPLSPPSQSDIREDRPAGQQREAIPASPRVGQQEPVEPSATDTVSAAKHATGDPEGQQIVRDAGFVPARPELDSSPFLRHAMTDSILRAVAAIWVLTSVFLLARLIASLFTVRRLIRQARVCDDPQRRTAAGEASRSLGLTTIPRVSVSPQVSTPMVLAFFRPTLLLPECDAMSSTTLWGTVFVHELAHVRRRDGWSRLWVQLVTIALPLQPLGWWMRRSFFAACEEACDDWAVAIGSDPLDLAEVLTVWAERADGRNVPLVAVGMSSTRSRTLRLLAMKIAPSATLARHWRLAFAIVTLIVCGGLAVAQAPAESESTESSRPVTAARRNESSSQAGDEAPPAIFFGTNQITVQPGAMVAGQVVLQETGAPATGAKIEFSNDRILADSWTRATADTDGRYLIGGLPPGEYRVSAQLAGRPNLFLPAVELTAGLNHQDLKMGQGGVISGRVIDVTTEQPIQLAVGEELQIIQTLRDGSGYSGMNFASIERDGTFSLRLPTGRQHFGMYLGPDWRGVNTDRLHKEGVEVVEGQITELEVRVRPRRPGDDQPPEPLSREAAADLAERTAIAAIRQLGGWVTLESIDGKEHVVEVNMVYHEDERMGREKNRLILDECLTYVPKFTQLRRLMLWHEQATDTGLASLRGMESLEEIFLWDASVVSDAGAAHLATLPNLKTIHLEGGKITDAALGHFSRLSRLEWLSLQRNQFTDKGLEQLQGLTQLRVLDLGLGDNRITDDGLRYLAEMTNLERIDLQNATQVTDAGLHHLHSFTNLKQLRLSGTSVTEAGREEMRKLLPTLELQ